MIAASVRTLVVSWNEAADKKLSVAKAALVIPSNAISPLASSPPNSLTLAFSSSKSNISIIVPGNNSVSPESETFTFLVICLTTTSKCLSLISTP